MIKSFHSKETEKLFFRHRLEKLTGDRQGLHIIRINDQWRICFRWSEGDAYEVEIADYH
jgi:proteic killer suppression protein